MQLFFQKCLNFLDTLCFFKKQSVYKLSNFVFFLKTVLSFFSETVHKIWTILYFSNMKKQKTCGLGRSFASSTPSGYALPHAFGYLRFALPAVLCYLHIFTLGILTKLGICLSLNGIESS